MALIPSGQYPAQTDTGDAGYPLGKARNSGAYQDGTGTPLHKAWVNDVWGLLQSLLADAEITASGDPDQVGASQYLEAIKLIAGRSTSERHLRALMQMRKLDLDGTTAPTADYMAVAVNGQGRVLIVKGGTTGVFDIADTEVVDLNGVSVTGLSGDCRAIAYNGTNRYVAVGNGSNDNSFSTSGSSWTAGGALGTSTPDSIVWDGTEFILVANSATRHSTNAVAWSAPSGSDVGTLVGGGIDQLAVFSPGVVLGIGQDVKVVKTEDHGATWALVTAIPTDLPNPAMRALVGDGSGEVLAFVKDGFGSLVECWVTTDEGDTWTKRSEHDGHDDGTTDFDAHMCQETGLVVVASGSGPTRVAASIDRGRTWSPLAFYYGVTSPSIGVARGRIFCAGGARIMATDPLIAE
jgi:hypothetical protein